MRNFLKMLLAVVLGILLCNFLLFLFFIGMMAIAVGGEEKTIVPSKAVLILNTEEMVVDRVQDPFAYFSPSTFEYEDPLELLPLLKAVRHAAEDSRIQGISIKVGGLGMGLAAASELRAALEEFKESGKFIYAYGTGFSQMGYYLASVADSIFLHPEGEMQWKGLATVMPYFKRSFDRFGISPQVVRHGKFKSAVEPFISETMSDANRLQTEQFLSALWGEARVAVSRSRGIAEAKLDSVSRNLVFLLGPEAQREHLVDALFYQDEYDDLLSARLDEESIKDVKTVTATDYVAACSLEKKGQAKASRVAVLYAGGNITDGDDIKMGIQGEAYRKEIEKLRKNEKIKAVVFRVNSGGGSALASDVMWRELSLLAEEKPLVVSMGDYAASGGYYISAPAHRIVADPMTITGSIGVFGLFFTVEGLMENALSISHQSVKTHASSDMLSLFRPLTDLERARMQNSVEQVYSTFVNKVALGRGITADSVDSIGQGRVWAGVDALRIGLVDTLAGLTTAIEMAAELAELDTYRTVSYPIREENPFETVLKGLSKKTSLSSFVSFFRPRESKIQQMQRLLEQDVEEMLQRQGIRAEMPIGRVEY